MKRTIEIDDDLQDRVENCKDELLDAFRDYMEDNADIEDFDTFYQDSGADRAHEIADSNTPIYYSDIDGLYYLYGNEFDEAYENAGIGDKSEDNYRQAAIYCYLSEKTYEFMSELQKWFDDKIIDLSDLNNEQIRKTMLLEAVNDLDTDLI